MSGAAASSDWNPGAYARFRDLRLRPGLDLLNAVSRMGAGDLIDLGCGNGALGEALKARAGGREVIGGRRLSGDAGEGGADARL